MNNGRGFAGMDPNRQRHQGSNSDWDADEAREMGRRGGMAASSHSRSAFHHDTAAHHHRMAGQHRADGRHEEADLHSDAAYGHGRAAYEHGVDADLHGDASRSNSGRGFAGMDPDRQREIASMGGRASHQHDNYRNEDNRHSGRGRDDEGRFTPRN